MRELTETLLAAQKQGSGIPFIRVEAVNKFAGAVRLDWERLYEGSEDEYFHSMTVPGDGSLIRVRICLPTDGRKLYRQRVANPGPGANFGTWVYTGQYGCLAVAAASMGSEVLIFWVGFGREVKYIRSTDYGINWGSPQIIDYTPSTAVNGLAAAFKGNGDIALFFCDQQTLYVKKRIGGSWQSKVAWDKTTGELSGVAAVYGTDWDIVVTGKDTSGNFLIWSLVYGDGGEIGTGVWSVLKELTSAPSDGDFEFPHIFMDKPDVFRFFYIEKFSGTESYSRPFRSQSITGAEYNSNLWTEPVPFNLSCEYGTAMGHHGDYCWLSTPNGVWRADLGDESVEFTDDIISLRQEITPDADRLTIELRNDDGRYSTLPAPLGTGCRLDISPGYITSQGEEFSSGQSYILEAYEYISRGGKAGLFLYAYGGSDRINNWTVSSQFRFNKSANELNIKQIMELVLARSGIRLEAVSQSSMITGFYPDFTIHSGSGGTSVIRKLLSFVPDRLFIEGDTAYLINPLASDNSVYSYGEEHSVTEGRYRTASWKLNRVTVEGYDPVEEVKIVSDSFAWEQIVMQQLRVERLEDRNIGSIEGAIDRGEVYLKTAEAESVNGIIDIPVNCGQQMYDVIDITDERAGLTEEKKRVTGITLVYNPGRGEYRQSLSLGAV